MTVRDRFPRMARSNVRYFSLSVKVAAPTADDAAPCIGQTLYGLREMVSFAMSLLTKQMIVRPFHVSQNSVIIIEVGVLECLERSTYTPE